MDYKKLADLLYPEINYNREFWENKYPKRNLESGMEVTRFAPSPTGYLHMGHFYGAMTDFLIAKSTGGVFYFRLEDTDKKREIDGAEIVALRMLEKFGIVPDEGLLASGEE
ncbi:MAG: glutamate--tRNA ligase family protein, partial [Clostridia bacterium]